MLRVHLLYHSFNCSDPAMEEALYEVPLYCRFVGLDLAVDTVPLAYSLTFAKAKVSGNYPDRIVPKPGHENDLEKRTLTSLYNNHPACLD